MACSLVFPAKADVMCVAALRGEWLGRLDQQTEVAIDCSALEMISAAAAQLVFALAKTVSATGGAVKLTHLSPAMRDDFMLLGLKDFF